MLNDISSPVLTATPRTYGKDQNSTIRKIETPERIEMKFGTGDYVHEISPKLCPRNLPKTKFGDDGISGASGRIREM